MFSTGSTTAANTSLFGQATPINQNRTGSSFLFGNTTSQPSALTSTPLSSSNVFGASTPAATPFQVGSTTGTGTTQKFDPPASSEKMTKNGIQTVLRTKLVNICAMTVYEKKSMEELRFEDYNDKRKFPSTTNSLFTSSLTPNNAGSTISSPFGGSTLTATTTASTNPSGSIFGGSSFTTPTATPTLGGSLFGAQPAAVTSSSTMPFAFGSSTTTPAATSTTLPFGSTAPTAATTTSSFFGAPTSTPSMFTFGGSQAAATTAATAPTFAFGASTSLFPTSTATTTTTPAASFGFSLPKPATNSTFSFMPSTATTTTPSFSLFPNATTTTAAAPLNQTITSATPAIFQSQSSVDTRTHLQLFQTMLNIQPFNSEMAFLAKNIKPNIGLDRNRLRTAPESALPNPVGSVFSPFLTKPSVLTSTTTNTPPSSSSSLGNGTLPNHAHTLPTVLLPSSSVTSSASLGLFGKRKLADSFLDDDDDNSLMMDDGPSTSMAKLPKSHVVKRPRVLDMNKIRSVVLGGGTGILETSRKGDENPSETFVVKSLPSTDQLSGWKKFANYDAYLASKTTPIDLVSQSQIDKSIPVIKAQTAKDRAVLLPRLTQDDYYTEPSISELHQYINEQGQCLVQQFTVGRKHYGSVTFRNSQINLTGLDLNRLIEIGRRQVTVYPDDNDKPIEGEEFNCPAIISLFGVYPIDRSSANGNVEITDPDRLTDMKYGNYLQEMTKKFQGHFIGYDVHTGTWQFRVNHF